MKNTLVSLLLILAQLGMLTETAFAADTNIQSDKVKIGRPSSGADKVIEFNVNAGSANPKLRATPGAGSIEFAPDGVNYKSVGSGSGSGGGGIPVPMQNGDFETGNGLIGWNPSVGGIFSIVSAGANLAEGKNTAQLLATNPAQYVQGTLTAVPNGLGGRSCATTMIYKTAEGTHPYILTERDGGGNAISSPLVLTPTNGVFKPAIVTYLCPSGGSIAPRIAADPSLPPSSAVWFDVVTEGENKFVQVAQSGVFGSVTYDNGCQWGMSGTGSFVAMTDGGACTSVVHGGLSTPTPTTLGFTLSNAPAGEYDISIRAAISAQASGHTNVACSYNAYDTTLSQASTSNLVGQVASSSGSPQAIVPMMNFHMSYSQPGNHVIEIHGAAHDAYESCIITTGDGSIGPEIVVTYHPSGAQIATQASGQAATWSGKIDGAAWGTSVTTMGSMINSPAGTFSTKSSRNLSCSQFGTEPGVSCNFIAGHEYKIRFASDAYHNTGGAGGQDVIFALTDGTTEISRQYTYSLYPISMSIEGHWIAPANGGHVYLQGQSSTSGGTGFWSAGGSQLMDMTIEDITQPGPTLILPGNVSSPSSGQEMIGRMYVSSCTSDPCVVQVQTPGLVTAVNRLGSGHYAIHLNPGFSTAGGDFPICTFTSTSTVGPVVIDQLNPMQVTFYNASPAPNDTGFTAICMGAK